MKKIMAPILMLHVANGIANAKTIRTKLTITQERVNLSGKKEVDFALMVNKRIPAPVLEFTEGDEAEITVPHGLKDDEVSIHWHGILLPPEMNGVAYKSALSSRLETTSQFIFL